MKFAKLYQQTLKDEGIPQDWADSGIQYKALKKCINRVVDELKQVGLERETLQALLRYQRENIKPGHEADDKADVPGSCNISTLENSTDATNIDTLLLNNDHANLSSLPISLVSYKFDGTANMFFPKIIVSIDEASNLPIDAKLSPNTLVSVKEMAAAALCSANQIDDEKVSEKDETENSQVSREKCTDSHNTLSITSDVLPSSQVDDINTLDNIDDADISRTDAVSIISGRTPFSSAFDTKAPETAIPKYEQNQSLSPISLAQSNDSLLNATQVQKSFPDLYVPDESFAEDRVPLLQTTENSKSPESLESLKSLEPLDSLQSLEPLESLESPKPSKSLETLESPQPKGLESPISSTRPHTPLPAFIDKLDTQEDAVSTTSNQHKVRLVEINLESDTVFFQMLMSELQNLDKFNQSQEELFIKQVDELRAAISTLVDPTARKTDMYVWREIFKEYMSSNIFFSTMESDHGEHDVDTARRKLIHFSARILGFNGTPQLLEELGFAEAHNDNSNINKSGSNIDHTSTSLPKPAITFPSNPNNQNALPQNSKELLEVEYASTAQIEFILGKFFSSHDPLAKLAKISHISGSGTSDSTHDNEGNATTNKILTKLRQYHISTARSRKPLLSQFRNRESYSSFLQFWRLNTALLRVLQFQAMNRMAVIKILKKFDKLTALDSHTRLPAFLETDQLTHSPSNHDESSLTKLSNSPTDSQSASFHLPFLSHSLAKNICFVISERLLPVTPQIDDFLCPICLSIAFKPIRLRCGHIFCIRCLIQLQRARTDKCPMCRQNSVLQSDQSNLDTEHLEFLKLHFPKETKVKQQEMEKQIAEEQMQHLKNSGECVLM